MGNIGKVIGKNGIDYLKQQILTIDIQVLSSELQKGYINALEQLETLLKL